MSAPNERRILFHYSEIGTKGGNRPAFEARLRRNLAGALRSLGVGSIRREPGRFSAPVDEDADMEAILARVRLVPGVAWCAPMHVVRSDLDEISRAVVEMAVAA